MTIGKIREELYDLIRVADDKKVKAIYTLLKDEAIEKKEWWEDEATLDEFDRRVEAWESGKEKGFTLEEVKASVLKMKKSRMGK